MKLTLASLAAMACLAAAPSLAQTPTTGGAMKPSAPAMTTTTPAKPAAATPSAQLLDINSASADEIGALKGVGKVRTAAIIKGRPYKGKDELVQKGIIPQAVYDDIKDKIIARQK